MHTKLSLKALLLLITLGSFNSFAQTGTEDGLKECGWKI